MTFKRILIVAGIPDCSRCDQIVHAIPRSVSRGFIPLFQSLVCLEIIQIRTVNKCIIVPRCIDT